MLSVESLIKQDKLVKEGDIVGVAVSGGTDSMALLHYLNKVKDNLKIQVVAITISHGLRENSESDAEFVVNYCQKNDIEVHKFSANLKDELQNSKKTVEQLARDYRYSVFEELLQKGTVTKIALGHHLQDQAETILLNIFRGAGLLGASGMETIRDGVYIRPLLRTPKSEIMAYVHANEIPYVEDETNQSNDYARNYIRNLIMPLVRNKWKNADQTISNFGEICKQDDEYINSTISDEGIIYENSCTASLPITYFAYPQSALVRILLRVFKNIGVTSNIEGKHFGLIADLALNGENGSSINLPNKVVAIKEYNFVTITNRAFKPKPKTWKFELGKTDITNFGVLEIKKIKRSEFENFRHVIDAKKLPKNVEWRYRQEGDKFEKFGGGTKSLSDYLTDKKVPKRLRAFVPVLASGNEILVIAGVEISDKVKVDDNSTTLYGINPVTFN